MKPSCKSCCASSVREGVIEELYAVFVICLGFLYALLHSSSSRPSHLSSLFVVIIIITKGYKLYKAAMLKSRLGITCQ